jgi:hypothetical protein
LTENQQMRYQGLGQNPDSDITEGKMYKARFVFPTGKGAIFTALLAEDQGHNVFLIEETDRISPSVKILAFNKEATAKETCEVFARRSKLQAHAVVLLPV